jgi:hypothetical protein
MNKVTLILTIVVSNMCFAQSTHPGLIVGDAVRIRESGSAKAKEISKVYGSRNVEIVEESKSWDDLGKKDDMCARHKWVKVKWQGDSTGWVYGKYILEANPDKNVLLDFSFKETKYKLVLFKNYSYPVGDDEGLTGCIWWYKVYFWNIDADSYLPVYDNLSKKEFTTMTLESSDGAYEVIKSMHSDNKKIYVKTEIGFQEGGAEADYIIEWKKDRFEVTSFVQSPTKY